MVHFLGLALRGEGRIPKMERLPFPRESHGQNPVTIFSFLCSSCLALSSSLSSCLVFFCLLSLSLSVSVWCCGRVVAVSCGVSVCVVVCGVLCCLVLRCVVWRDTLKTPPCAHSKRPRVCRHHAHVCFNMCAWCRYTRGRF